MDEHPKLSLQMEEMIDDLEANGYLLFGQKHIKSVKYGDKESEMTVTNFAVKRKDNPDIVGVVDWLCGHYSLSSLPFLRQL